MATTVTKIIDPDNGSGTDYTSLSAWEAGEQGDLTGARDEIAVAKCRCTGGTADTTAVTIDGWTTSSTQYIKIWTDPAESYRHNGTWQAGNKYRLLTASLYNGVITSAEGYVVLEGLQLNNSGSRAEQAMGFRNTASSGTAELSISKCIILGSGTGTPTYNVGIWLDGFTGFTAKIWNNIIYDWQVGIRDVSYTNPSYYIYNNTIYGCTTYGIVFEGLGGTTRLKNNLCNGNGTDYSLSGMGGTREYVTNLSEDTSSPNDTLDSKAVSFSNEGGDDFHLAAADTAAKDAGTDLSADGALAFSDDIDGSTRSGTWDIGADEYVAASSTPLFRRRLNILLRLCLSTFNLIGRCFK